MEPEGESESKTIHDVLDTKLSSESTSDNQSAALDGDKISTIPLADGGPAQNPTNDLKVNVEEAKIPEDFYYDYEELVCKPHITEGAQDQGLHSKYLNLRFAFGYNCQKRDNLHVLDESTICFAAGNYVQFFNLKTREQKFLPTLGGAGVGAITVHASRSYIAVGEKGKEPVVAVFEWPSLKLWRILKHGTEDAFAHLCFSPDGNILAALGAEPDYMLTLYDWRQEKILLRAKAHGQDVFRVSFSQELAGQLTTSGSGHIKFWKMADTFTGLKLQGRLGRFGKTEISDIEGYIELPDGKVLSGCEWGNMLLWDDGLIKLEVIRKGKKHCHGAAVEQILLVEGEILTVGLDGFIRVWDLDTIDTADVSAEHPFLEMEPMNELKAVLNGPNAVGEVPAALHSIVRSMEPEVWFAQDKNGGVWKLDLSFTHTSAQPQKLLSAHSGDVPALAISPVAHMVATAGSDSSVRLYDFNTGVLLGLARFPSPASTIVWGTSETDEQNKLVIVGFSDGVIRLLLVQPPPPPQHGHKPHIYAAELALKAAFKPHVGKVTQIALDVLSKLMVTGGDDSTVFFFDASNDFEPVGFVTVPGPVTYLCFNNEKEDPSAVRLLVSCANGIVCEVKTPIDPNAIDHSKTYKLSLEHAKITRYMRVKSIKSRLRHDEEREKIKLELEKNYKKLCKERQEMALRGLIPEGEPIEPPEPEMPPDEWEEFIPEEPCTINFALYATDNDKDKVLVSRGGYDAGYLYECQLPTSVTETPMDPIACIPVPESDDSPITCFTFSKDRMKLYCGFENGTIRVNVLETQGAITNESLTKYFSYRQHDCHTGAMKCIRLSHDEKYFLSSSEDGTIFCSSIEEPPTLEPATIPVRSTSAVPKTDDIIDPNAYSIEEAKQKLEHDRAVAAAEARKDATRMEIQELRKLFVSVIESNEKLPSSLRLDPHHFEMDEEIRGPTLKANEEKIEIAQKEVAFEQEKTKLILSRVKSYFYQQLEFDLTMVRSFSTDHFISTFPLVQPTPDFEEIRNQLETIRLQSEANRGTSDIGSKIHMDASDKKGDGFDAITNPSLDKVDVKVSGALGDRISRALKRVSERKLRRAKRRQEWENLRASEPGADWEDPDDVAAIEYAKLHIGDYKLKSADDYVVPPQLRMNAFKAALRLLQIKEYVKLSLDIFICFHFYFFADLWTKALVQP